MKRTKKLAALVLAMVMAFSLMAVTAAAAGTEEHVHDCVVCSEETIQPRIPMGWCNICNVATTTWVHYLNGKRVVDFICPNNDLHNICNIPW